tara:strand:+ start:4349 stop:5710 length:1362 start_codon:yes stop_codon:yes gene_type:complete
MSTKSKRSEQFRSAIAAFIEARREAKLKGREDDVEVVAKYEYVTWLVDAAKRAGAIQLVTHPLKATYPDAKIKEATSPFIQGCDLAQHEEIGSHLISDDFLDGSGDAAALGTFKFLTEVLVEERPLVHWLLNDDPDLFAAFSADHEQATQIALDFKKILRTSQSPAAHAGAKQIYWLVGNTPLDDNQFHLLQPMFSSSIAHVVHINIQDARFGETNKLARHAFYTREAHDRKYLDYRDLVARKLGGTKPQNISMRNSERGGVNYLLASLPPKWQHERKPRLLNLESSIERFAWFEGVPFLLRKLAAFLKSIADKPRNMDIVEKREAIEQALGQQLALFAVSIRASLEPGWSRDPDCKLPLCEKLWLDSERIELPLSSDPEQADEDRAFNAAYTFGDWPDEIVGRFANWVNERLREAGLTAVSEVEYWHWAKQAIIDTAWPVPMERRAPLGGEA